MNTVELCLFFAGENNSDLFFFFPLSLSLWGAVVAPHHVSLLSFTFAASVIDVSKTTSYFRHLGFIRLPVSHSPLHFLSLELLFTECPLRRTPLLYKDCIDIHLYLMKILSNNNATVRDYQTSNSCPAAPCRSGPRDKSVTYLCKKKPSLSHVDTCLDS